MFEWILKSDGVEIAQFVHKDDAERCGECLAGLYGDVTFTVVPA
jgi:hypothetical protein